MIARDQLVEMFDGMAESNWDLTKPLLWGYFFTDSSQAKLKKVAPLLEELGYSVVKMFLADKDDLSEDDDSDEDLWWLHVEKIEVHSVDSLFARNEVFYEFALQHDLASYDGMDVGPVE